MDEVPLFFYRQSEENYTDVFYKARNKRGSVKMHPKNPQHPNIVKTSPFQMESKSGLQHMRTKHTRNTSQEDGDPRRTHNTERAARHNIGSDSDHRIEHRSPQTKVGGKGSAISAPSSERKGSTERVSGDNLAPLIPGRSRLRSVTQDSETLDDETAVPKFGDWDERDPKSADEFTHVFNKVREEKLNGKANVAPVKAFQNSYPKAQRQHENEMSKRCCCFPRMHSRKCVHI